MIDMEKVIRIIDELIVEAQKEPIWKAENALRCLKKELLKEQEKKEIKLERYVPIELFLEVLEKYKESESSRIWERSTHIREDLKELDEEISKYKNCCF